MPTNRGKRRHKYQGTQLDPSIEEFFLTGTAPKGTAGHALRVSRFFEDSENDIADAWAQHKDFLLRKWKAEGRTGIPWILKDHWEF